MNTHGLDVVDECLLFYFMKHLSCAITSGIFSSVNFSLTLQPLQPWRCALPFQARHWQSSIQTSSKESRPSMWNSACQPKLASPDFGKNCLQMALRSLPWLLSKFSWWFWTFGRLMKSKTNNSSLHRVRTMQLHLKSCCNNHGLPMWQMTLARLRCTTRLRMDMRHRCSCCSRRRQTCSRLNWQWMDAFGQLLRVILTLSAFWLTGQQGSGDDGSWDHGSFILRSFVATSTLSPFL